MGEGAPAAATAAAINQNGTPNQAQGSQPRAGSDENRATRIMRGTFRRRAGTGQPLWDETPEKGDGGN